MTFQVSFSHSVSGLRVEQAREATEELMKKIGFVVVNGHYNEEYMTVEIEARVINPALSDDEGSKKVRVMKSDVRECRNCGHLHYIGNSYCGEFCTLSCKIEWHREHKPDHLIVKTSGGRTLFIPPGELMPYNSIQQNMAETTDSDPYLIGFEVEKEDCVFFDDEGLPGDIVSEAHEEGWLCVSDGSLDEWGFELVSPAFNLTATDGLHSRRDLQRACERFGYLDADYSDNCGGHITVSKMGMTGPELVDHFGEFPALLFALYPSRLQGDYAYGRSKAFTKRSTDKFRAINCQENRVEFRIFSAVENGEQLEWRTRLIHEATILADAGKSITDALNDPKSPLVTLLKEKVDFLDDMKRRFELFLEFWNTGKIDDEIADYFENC